MTMKILSIMTLIAIGCGSSQSSAPDAGADAPPDAAVVPDSFNAPVGAACSTETTRFCHGGGAWCFDGVCRDYCSVIDPACPAGSKAQRSQTGVDVCVCVPE
jgi:hypothetical protein